MNFNTRFRRAALKSGEEKGQAAIEMLLILPFFLLFILLAIDFGIWTYQSIGTANAVREGARYGAVNCGVDPCSASAVAQRAAERSNGFLSETDFEVGWVERAPSAAGTKGSSVVVRIASGTNYPFLFFAGVNLPLVSCADMRLEQTEDSPSSLPVGTDC